MEKYLLLAMRGCMFASGIHNCPRLMAFPQHHPLQCAAGSSAVAQATNIVFSEAGGNYIPSCQIAFLSLGATADADLHSRAYCSAMVTGFFCFENPWRPETTKKNGAYPKSLMSRGKIE